ncbi:hypothetical protein G6F22_015293 [Rhizopus arrhizus]|nr:hypothetical protein G6F22_015293 [Rhizopus arrhizus]
MRTMLAQPLVQLVAESTEVAIAAIAQREHAVVQVLHRRWRGHYPAQERQRMVGRVALTGGAGDEQRALAGRQQCCVHLMQTAHTHRHAGTAQGLGTAFGQFAGETGLAGPDQQDRRGIARWGVVTRAATPPQRGTGQRIQRRGDQLRPDAGAAAPTRPAPAEAGPERCRATRATDVRSCILLVEQALEGAAEEFARAFCCALQVACGQSLAFGQCHAVLAAEHSQRGGPGIGMHRVVGNHGHCRCNLAHRHAGTGVEAVAVSLAIGLVLVPAIT